MSIAATIVIKIAAKISAKNEIARRRRARSFGNAARQEIGSRAGGKPL
jgi:hypothetical protein